MTMTPARPNATHWPGLDAYPAGPKAKVAARIARQLFRAAVRRLPVTVVEGSYGGIGTGGPKMTIHRPEEFYARLGRDGLIGFGEAYLTQAWEAEDLGGFLTVLSAQLPTLIPAPLQKLRKAYVRRPPSHQKNSEDNTRGNIAHHYDLSNDMFRLFLDETMSYSSALYDATVVDRGDHLQAAPPEGHDSEALESAQVRKIDRLLDQTGVGEGTRVLEIGTGWGELAIRAARRGATVHSVTLSSEQLELAESRVAEAGHSEQVSIALSDYRDVQGQYDAIVSVEMIEAVGWKDFGTFFERCAARLEPDGAMALQAITVDDRLYDVEKASRTFIRTHIFPDGCLPSVDVIARSVARHTDLRIVALEDITPHYAETLRRWRANLDANASDLAGRGYDARFQRMWRLYLCWVEAGFTERRISNVQVVLAKPAWRGTVTHPAAAALPGFLISGATTG